MANQIFNYISVQRNNIYESNIEACPFHYKLLLNEHGKNPHIYGKDNWDIFDELSCVCDIVNYLQTYKDTNPEKYQKYKQYQRAESCNQLCNLYGVDLCTHIVNKFRFTYYIGKFGYRIFLYVLRKRREKRIHSCKDKNHANTIHFEEIAAKIAMSAKNIERLLEDNDIESLYDGLIN